MALRVPKAKAPRELERNMIDRFGAVAEDVAALWPRTAQRS